MSPKLLPSKRSTISLFDNSRKDLLTNDATATKKRQPSNLKVVNEEGDAAPGLRSADSENNASAPDMVRLPGTPTNDDAGLQPASLYRPDREGKRQRAGRGGVT